MSQKRGMPHAHICVSLDPRDKIRLGVNNPKTNDRLDQLIWGEIPVAWNSKYRPAGWRTKDSHRSDRWTEHIKLEDEEIEDNSDEDNCDMEDLGKENTDQNKSNDQVEDACPEGIIYEYPEGFESRPEDFEVMQRLSEQEWKCYLKARKIEDQNEEEGRQRELRKSLSEK